jgi:hypothetical protein
MAAARTAAVSYTTTRGTTGKSGAVRSSRWVTFARLRLPSKVDCRLIMENGNAALTAMDGLLQSWRSMVNRRHDRAVRA